jgi:DNA-binding beta-propeller fold protein YncE/uncharacterized membrane protein (GlpM family)
MYIIVFTVMFSCLPFAGGPSVHASLPYETRSTDANGQWIWTPAAFVPAGVWSGFNAPEDLFVTRNDEIFVADTGNNRIVRMDTTGKITQTYPVLNADQEPVDPLAKLRKPEGVFVADNGEIYVADTGSRRIAVFAQDGTFIREYLEPQDPTVSQRLSFNPSKVVLDRRGYLYIANKGGYQGLLQMTPEGQFSGFFGANKVSVNWIESLKRRFYTDEQMKDEMLRLPGAVINMAVDNYGFIYTLNRGMQTGQLRRLNSGGIDLFQQRNFAPWIIPPNTFTFTDISVDQRGFMTSVEVENGEIFQYDADGNLIFRFGGKSENSQRLGLIKRATGVAVLTNGNILVADGELSNIQIFKRTEFGTLVHNAIANYLDGLYQESEQYWQQILTINGNYDRAYQGIGKAQYYKGNYASSGEYFKEARDTQGYSESFWQTRLRWLLNYFGIFMSILLVVVIGIPLIRSVLVRTGVIKPAQAVNAVDRTQLSGWKASFKQSLRVLRHPIAGMTEIGEGLKVPYLFSILLVIIAFIVSLLGKYVVSFLFYARRFEDLNLLSEMRTFFLIWIFWVIASYLIGSVLRGQGTFRKVLAANSIALMPMILFLFPVQWLSNALTLQEGIIYTMLNNGIQLWVLVLIFIGTQAVQNFNFKENLQMVSVSFFTFACLWMFGFVLVGLFVQAYDFFTSLGQELIDRVI